MPLIIIVVVDLASAFPLSFPVESHRFLDTRRILDDTSYSIRKIILQIRSASPGSMTWIGVCPSPIECGIGSSQPLAEFVDGRDFDVPVNSNRSQANPNRPGWDWAVGQAGRGGSPRPHGDPSCVVEEQKERISFRQNVSRTASNLELRVEANSPGMLAEKRQCSFTLPVIPLRDRSAPRHPGRRGRDSDRRTSAPPLRLRKQGSPTRAVPGPPATPS